MSRGDTILLPGDIVFTKGSSLLSKAIRFCTRTFGEPRTRVNHVGIVVTEARAKHAHIVEALTSVVEHPLWDYAEVGDRVSVYRCTELTENQRKMLAIYARQYKGKKYGYTKIAAHFLDWLLLGSYAFRRLTDSDDYPICSWVVAKCYSKLGLDFGVAPGAATPDDIDDYVRRHPKKYTEILSLETLEA